MTTLGLVVAEFNRPITEQMEQDFAGNTGHNGISA